MDLIIEQEKKGRIEIFQQIPEGLQDFAIKHAFPNSIEGDFFKALWLAFPGIGFIAWYNRYWMKAPVILKGKGDRKVLELRIALKGLIRGTWDKIKIAALPVNHFQMGFVPNVSTRAIFDTAEFYEAFDIEFEVWWLESLGFKYKKLERFISNIHNKNQAELVELPHYCTTRMMDYVYDVLYNRYSEYGRGYKLEEAAKGILFEALEAVYIVDRPLPKISPAEREKLKLVKSLIEADCPLFRGIDKLREASELNESDLHYKFKQLFGCTPMDYYQEVRLMMARNLLRAGLTVVEVAYKIEYLSSTPFINAFRRRFGYTPKEFQYRNM